jgi:hypothetical protein
MAVASHHSGLGGLAVSDIDDLERLIIRNGTDEVLGDGVVLDVIDNLAVMSVLAGGVQNSGVGLEGVEIPSHVS